MSTVSDGRSSPRRLQREQDEQREERRQTSERRQGGGARAATRPATRSVRSGAKNVVWFGWLSILVPLVALPVSFFVWFGILELGSYPRDHAVTDLIAGFAITALFHAALVAGILFGVLSIRARRRDGRVPVLGWIGVVLGLLTIVYWELLVSPWLLDLWNAAFPR